MDSRLQFATGHAGETINVRYQEKTFPGQIIPTFLAKMQSTICIRKLTAHHPKNIIPILEHGDFSIVLCTPINERIDVAK